MIYEPIWGAIIAWYLFLAGLGGGAFATAVFVRYAIRIASASCASDALSRRSWSSSVCAC